MIFQDRMAVDVNMLVSNPSGDLGEGIAKMEAQVTRIDLQNFGSSTADIRNATVSA